MGKELKHGPMAQFMRETFSMIKNMALDPSVGKTVLSIKDSCSKICFTDGDPISGQMVVITKENFRIIKCMDKETSDGQMVNVTKVLMKMICDTAEGKLSILTIKS